MQYSNAIHVVIALILAVIGYFVAPMALAYVPVSVLFALGLLAGGVLTPVIASMLPARTEGEADSSDGTQTLYVGNLPYKANEQAVKDHFAAYGEVASVRLMKDRRTGKRKGYGFVEVSASSAASIVSRLNDSEFQERTLKVRMAKEKSHDE